MAFFTKGPKGLDPNALAPFEVSIFTAIVGAYVPNVVFLSLRLQLLEWLAVGSVKRISGLPDWWKRYSAGDQFVLSQQRLVGGIYSVPKELGPVELELGLLLEGHGRIPVTFVLDESVRTVAFRLPDPKSRHYPSGNVQLVKSQINDDRAYWQSRGDDHPEFQDLSKALLGFLSEEKPSRTTAVILPAPGLDEIGGIDGVSIAGSTYGRLLRLANGIRVNSLLIWGSYTIGTRKFRVRDKDFLYIGDDGESLLALQVLDGAVGEEVHKVTPQSARGLGRDVGRLCKEALGIIPAL